LKYFLTETIDSSEFYFSNKTDNNTSFFHSKANVSKEYAATVFRVEVHNLYFTVFLWNTKKKMNGRETFIKTQSTKTIPTPKWYSCFTHVVQAIPKTVNLITWIIHAALSKSHKELNQYFHAMPPLCHTKGSAYHKQTGQSQISTLCGIRNGSGWKPVASCRVLLATGSRKWAPAQTNWHSVRIYAL
jgi:hypothetical protein